MLDDGSYLGLGVRALNSELDFSDTLGDVDFTGVQPMLTYTRKL